MLRPLLIAVLALAAGCSKGGGAPPLDGGLADAPAFDGAVPVDVPDPLAPPPVVPEATIPAPRSGSRIKVGAWQTADGMLGETFWWDSQLKTECAWKPAADGVHRCVPDPAIRAFPTTFGDPMCTQPVLTGPTPGCTPRPAYIATPIGSTCPIAFAAANLGAPVHLNTLYRSNEMAVCEGYPHTESFERPLYNFGPEIPPAMLVGAEVRVGPAAGGLAPVFLDGQDGSSGFLTWRDVAGGFDCQLRTAGDGQLRCLPTVLGTIGTGSTLYYTDSACKILDGHGDRSTCAADSGFVSESRIAGCAERTIVHRAGTRLSQYYFKGADGVCEEANPSRITDHFAPGEEVAPSTFQPGAVAMVAGPGRLQPLVHTTAAGARAYGSLWDSTVGVRCNRSVARDGSTRCVGFPLQITLDLNITSFADPACKTPLVAGGCLRTIGVLERDTCPTRFHFYQVGAQHTGPAYRWLGGLCQVDPKPFGPLHQLSAEVDPAALVELTRTIP